MCWHSPVLITLHIDRKNTHTYNIAYLQVVSYNKHGGGNNSYKHTTQHNCGCLLSDVKIE